MKKLLLAAVASGAVATGCLLQPCPAIDCADVLEVAVKDSAGQALNTFSGKVTIAFADDDAGIPARHIRVACGSGQPGDAGEGGSPLADGGTAFEQEALCRDGGFMIFGGRNGPITATLQSGSLSFDGGVSATFTETQVGPDRCETSCSSGVATISLQ